ncbi:MAG: hypothetical protein TUN42_00845 [Dehalogenimonas sp.]
MTKKGTLFYKVAIIAAGALAILASVLVGIGPTSVSAQAESGAIDKFGWNLDARTPAYPNWPGDWTTGNLGSNWREGDWVSYVYVLRNTGDVPLNLPTINIYYDFYFPNGQAIFVDLLAPFSFGWWS